MLVSKLKLFGNTSHDTLLYWQYGADVNRSDHWGVTPMYLAATNAQLEVIRYLIVAGAQLTYRNKVCLYLSNYCQ